MRGSVVVLKKAAWESAAGGGVRGEGTEGRKTWVNL
jgi:hypothetical protein